MKPVIIFTTTALIALAGPIAIQSQANDAHHPEKAASKKVTKTKPKQQQKKPAEKTGKSQQQGELSVGRQKCVA
jgi:hypothetical protein